MTAGGAQKIRSRVIEPSTTFTELPLLVVSTTVIASPAFRCSSPPWASETGVAAKVAVLVRLFSVAMPSRTVAVTVLPNDPVTSSW